MSRVLTFKLQVMLSFGVLLQILREKIVALVVFLRSVFNAFNKRIQILFLFSLVFSSESLSICRSGKLSVAAVCAAWPVEGNVFKPSADWYWRNRGAPQTVCSGFIPLPAAFLCLTCLDSVLLRS